MVSGPYTLEEVKMDRSIKLVRRGDWWGRVRKYNLNKYNFDHVYFKSMEDRTQALELFKKGEFDCYTGFYSVEDMGAGHATLGFEQQCKKNWVGAPGQVLQ